MLKDREGVIYGGMTGKGLKVQLPGCWQSIRPKRLLTAVTNATRTCNIQHL